MKRRASLRGLAYCLCALDVTAISFAEPLDKWSLRNSGTTNCLYGVVYANGIFVAVGDQGAILISGDGSTWVRRDSGTTSRLRAITYGNGAFIAMGDNECSVASYPSNLVVSLDNGVTWTALSSPLFCGLRGVAYGNGTFVVAGNDDPSGQILTSSDGTDWTWHFYSDLGYLRAVSYGASNFIAADYRIFTSLDGANWSHRLTTATFLYGITYDQGVFVAVGNSCYSGPGRIFTSSDAVTWSERTLGSEECPVSVTSGNGSFLVVGNYGLILSSADGFGWTNRQSGVLDALLGVAYGRNTFVAVGCSGTILQSEFFGPPVLIGRLQLSDGGFEVTVTAEIGRSYRLQASTNLVNWDDLVTFTNTETTVQFSDPTATNFLARFYRVASP